MAVQRRDAGARAASSLSGSAAPDIHLAKSGAHSAEAVLPTAVISARVASSHTGAPGPDSGSCVRGDRVAIGGRSMEDSFCASPVNRAGADSVARPRRRRYLPGDRTVRCGCAVGYKRPPGRSSAPRRALILCSRGGAQPRQRSAPRRIGLAPRLQLREAAAPGMWRAAHCARRAGRSSSPYVPPRASSDGRSQPRTRRTSDSNEEQIQQIGASKGNGRGKGTRWRRPGSFLLKGCESPAGAARGSALPARAARRRSAPAPLSA